MEIVKGKDWVWVEEDGREVEFEEGLGEDEEEDSELEGVSSLRFYTHFGSRSVTDVVLVFASCCSGF